MCTAPRSRNFVAAEDGKWYVPPGGDPMVRARAGGARACPQKARKNGVRVIKSWPRACAPPRVDEPVDESTDEPTDLIDEPSPGGGGGICGGTKIYIQPSTWSQGAWQHFIVETQSLPDDSAGNEVVISVGVAGDYATDGDVAGDYATVDKLDDRDKLDDLELVEVWNAVPGSIKNKAGESLLSFTTKKWQTAFGFQARYKSDVEKATSPAMAKWNADDC